MPARPILCLLLAALLFPAVGCASTTIAVKEKLGYAKREQLVDEVKHARNAQQKAKEQFATTLEEFKAVTGFDGGDLERQYNKLKTQADRSRDRASAVRGRIDSVERIANAMFREWDQELNQYSSETLRAASQEQLDLTRQRYRQLLDAMKTAEARMTPVLTAFDDQVLFLKHNLNARAIASLQTTVNELETEIAALIEEMNRSIDEANAFIEGMQDG
ncbi:MAG: DUF2959 domain-containing protein [Planctomycetota bacterium]|nr:MAG: DUF2959 domain-containing protein [Planctomycetota bacterium]